MTGLYVRQADRMGALGLAGLLVAVPGILAFACVCYVEALFPVLAADDPKLLAWDGPLFHSGILRGSRRLPHRAVHTSVSGLDDLTEKAIAALRRLQDLPGLIRGFFADPHLRYITA